MPTDPKATWPIVKFLIAATGLRRREARRMLDEIPSDRHSQLFIKALAWDRDSGSRASQELSEILGGKILPTLQAATKRAKKPSTASPDEDDYDEGQEQRRQSSTKRKDRAKDEAHDDNRADT